MRPTRTIAAALAAFAFSLSAPPTSHAQQEPPAGETYFTPPPGEGSFLDRVKISGWANLNYRNSEDHRVRDNFPFPSPVFLETPDPGGGFEASDVTIVLDIAFSPSIAGKVKIDFIDLYNRNPTSTDDKFDVDELWIRFGPKYEARIVPPGSSFYLLLGKAPKFEKQVVRHLESYGLVSTAFNRMGDLQLQLGGSVGQNLYWRAQASAGNPLFMRDPNALAGDNGTTLDINADRTVGNGFPILYDAEVENLDSGNGKNWEGGGGLGLRFGADDGSSGFDLLGFYYNRELADRVALNGTLYGGDLDLLSVDPYALPYHGRTKREYGGNLDAKWGGVSLFGQFVRQDIAGLWRNGLELELAWRALLPPVLALDGAQFFTFLQPVVRWSRLDDDFAGPREFPAPSFWWDWTKVDYGLRVGLVKGIDVTFEYSRNEVDAKTPFTYGEGLATLHAGF